LIFSPKQNIIRNTFQNYIPQWIIQEPIVELDWNAVLQTLEGHSSWVNSVAFSHDSKLLASGSYDDTIKIWDTATGTLQQTLEGHSGSVNSVAFSHDSKLLASGSYDDTIKIWDAATGTLQQTLKGHTGSVNSVAFSHDSKLLASGSYDDTIKIWDAATGTLQQTLEGRSGWVRSVAFSHDSKLLASGSEDATIKIWDAATGTLQETLEGHSGWVNSVAFSHDSKLLASGSDDATIKIWDAATGTLQQTAMVNNLITSLVFDSTNSTVITDIGHIKVDGTKSNLCEVSQRPDSQSNCQSISISGPWIIWNTQNLLWIPTDYRPGSVNISPSGSIVAIGCASGRVFVIEFSLALLPALNN
jgi:WD40 repeat protein